MASVAGCAAHSPSDVANIFAPFTTASDKAELVKCISAVAKNTSVRATAAPAPGTPGPNPVDGHKNAVPIVPVKSKDASTEALAGAWYVGTSSQNVAPNGFYSLFAGPCPSGYNAISCGVQHQLCSPTGTDWPLPLPHLWHRRLLLLPVVSPFHLWRDKRGGWKSLRLLRIGLNCCRSLKQASFFFLVICVLWDSART